MQVSPLTRHNNISILPLIPFNDYPHSSSFCLIFHSPAVTKKELKDSGVKAEKQVSELEEIGCVVLELGYFIDFSGKGLQDPLSVVLSLTGEEQEEERVDISINEMLEEYVWSKD